MGHKGRLSNLWRPLQISMQRIIGLVHHLKIAEVHFHKYSLDVHLRSTVRALNPQYDMTRLSLSPLPSLSPPLSPSLLLLAAYTLVAWGQIDRQLT